ncbi:hypothetical protein J4734_16310 [Klebsiella pneumoniae]|uniref:Uncharacterized protein n=1 Tax=Klebsiella pneumoniae TaxID=573 RepID=A0A939NN73_KLEPN|nr:hypothetical protein [Klebsiella pneumoniae]
MFTTSCISCCSSERERLGLEYPNEYYLQDFSGDTDIEWIQNAMDWVHDAGGGWLIISSTMLNSSSSSQFTAAMSGLFSTMEIKLQDGVHDNLFRAAGLLSILTTPLVCARLKSRITSV